MAKSPYPLEGVALARRTLTDGAYLTSVTAEAREELCDLAFGILHKDRAARLGLDPAAPHGPARVITIPRAVFQAGRRSRRILRVVGTHPTTPGDAA